MFSWYNTINYSLLFTLWVLIYINRSLFSVTRKYLFFFWVTYAITEFFSVPISLIFKNNLFLYSISHRLQFLFLVAYFIKILDIGKIAERYIIIIALFIVLSFLSKFGFRNYNSTELLIYNAIYIIFCALYFNKIIRTDYYVTLANTEFWFVSSLFIFFGCNICINGAMEYLIAKDIKAANKLFYGLVINAFVFYVMTILILAFKTKFKRSL